MKFFCGFPGRWVPIIPELMTGEAHRKIAIAAERLGYYGVLADEHPAPVESWLAGPGGHHCIDPFVCLASVAAVTTRLRVLTYLAVVPYRNPFLFAKTATSLDIVSDGRLILGVGLGYMKGEADALGVDFERRNELFEEGLDIFRRCCTGEPVKVVGPYANDDPVVMLPLSVQRPHPPLWIGGTSKISRRRAVDFAQGWMPTPRARNHAYHKVPPLENKDDLRELLKYMWDYAAEVGRTAPLDVVVTYHKMIDESASLEGQLEQVEELREMGVTGITGGFGSGLGMGPRTLVDAIAKMEEFAEKVIKPCGRPEGGTLNPAV